MSSKSSVYHSKQKSAHVINRITRKAIHV